MCLPVPGKLFVSLSSSTQSHRSRAFRWIDVACLGLPLLVLAACVVKPAPTPAPSGSPPEVAEDPAPLSGPRVVELEDGSYVEISPGTESGFAHCCGDSEFMMEIECTEGLVRCYQHRGNRWKQTYGKHCKHALERECYEQTCARVCEAYWEIGDPNWLGNGF